jgi:diguanylate cyclase (GGDEF)-like protein/PAS domain S-box-containing protein
MKWFPKSLLNRLFLIISVTTLLFVAIGMLLFYQAQFSQEIEDAQNSANMLMEVAAQAVEESAVIGDYDTVKRTLSKLVASPSFHEARFIDMSGSVIRAQEGAHVASSAPAWLRKLIAANIYDVNRNIAMGGRDYGVMRLSFDIDLIADHLWQLGLQSALVAGVFMLVSLSLIRTFLGRWLGNLNRLQSYQQQVLSGEVNATASAHEDAPAEIREAFEVVNRTAAHLRNEFGQRIDSLMHALIQHKNAMDQVANVVELDADGRIIYVNEQFLQASGQSREALLHLQLSEVGDTGAGEEWSWVPGNSAWRGEIRMRCGDGRSNWYQRTILPIMNSEGHAEKYICIDIDIDARKLSEQATAAHAKRQSLVAQFGNRVLEIEEPEILWQEAAAIAAQGLEARGAASISLEAETKLARLAAGSGWLACCVGAELASPESDAWELYGDRQVRVLDTSACAMLTQAWRLEGDCALHSGLHVPVASGKRHFGALAVYDRQARSFSTEEIDFVITVGNTLAAAIEAREAAERLTYMAQFDALTDLPNRSRLMTGLNETLLSAKRHGRKAAVMFVDLDRFKIVNDTMGHGVGDLLLMQAGRRLRESVRSGDFVARLGGDEFAVVLGELQHSEDANTVAQKLISAMEQAFELSGQRVHVSASIGIAVYPDDGEDASYLLQCADTAMYGAKRAGRNAYQVYLPQMNAEVLERMRLENRLREALPRGELLLHYQPKVSLPDDEISGFEALLRWHPDGEAMVPPNKFIPIMEDTGMIVTVGEWVLQTVCDQLVSWESSGLPLRPVAINLSARQFQQADMVARMGAIIAASGVDPALLEFELTESMLMIDPEAAALTLQQLKSLGVRLSIDDFGTGYSSLAYLKRFPLDKLKIDRAFVRDVSTDTDDAAITLAIISLAHSLNLTVVAEGVETADQLQLLMANGCDEMQGYYFSRPLPEADCAAMLRQDRKPSALASEPWAA